MSQTPRFIVRILRLMLSVEEAGRVVEYLDELAGVHRRSLFWFLRHAFSISLGVRRDRDSGMPTRRKTSMNSLLLNVWIDVRLTIRNVVRQPLFSLIAIVTLAVGFGLNTSMFSVVRKALLEQLPFPQPEELVRIWDSGDFPISAARFDEFFEREPRTVELSAYTLDAFALVSSEVALEIQGAQVSWNHFNVFGLPPELGRGFSESDSEPGASPVVAISYELWSNHFDRDSSIIGRDVELYRAAAIPMVSGAFSGTRLRVVAVLPRDYQPFEGPVSVLTPIILNPGSSSYTNLSTFQLIGRTVDGATYEQVRDEMRQHGSQVLAHNDQRALGMEAVTPLRSFLVGDSAETMLLLQGALLLLLLLAGANFTNLMFVRQIKRRRELAVRLAIGAGRGRLIQQLVVESLCITILAGIAGFILSATTVGLLMSFLPDAMSADAAVLDPLVIAVAAMSMVVIGLVTGIGPALRGTTSVQLTLREGKTGTAGSHRITAGLVALQVALAVVLTTGAGLTLRSFVGISNIDLGIDTEQSYTIRVAPVEAKYSDVGVRRQFIENISDQFRTIPGVTEVGATHFLPVGDGGVAIGIRPPVPSEETRVVAAYKVITPGYLDAIGLPLVRGRDISSSDVADGEPVALVNQAFVDEFMNGEEPVGTPLIRVSGNLWATVVGVVGNMRQEGPLSEPYSEVYVPLAQSSWASAMSFVVRTATEVPGLADQMRSLVGQIDPNVPVQRVTSLQSVVESSYSTERFFMIAFGIFATMALLLGCVGIYGITTFAVSARRRDMGIMLALGASGRRIAGKVLTIGAMPAIVGLVAGVGASLYASRFVERLLFGVTPNDPLILGAVVTILLVVVVATHVSPALNAVRIDPVDELRSE